VQPRKPSRKGNHRLRRRVDALAGKLPLAPGSGFLAQSSGMSRIRARWEHLQHDLVRGPLLPVFDAAARWMIDTDVSRLRAGLAHLLNWAAGHTGYVAQSGLWINHPVVPEHRPHGVVLRHVTERIVEVPFAFAAAALLRPGSVVLDLGARGSTLALSLASLGVRTIALDQRPYPLSHPLLTVVRTNVENWEPAEPLDAIFCISTIEHLGLPSYGTSRLDEDLDRKTTRRMRSWLHDRGFLVLTVPIGEWSVNRLERTYDAPHLEALLEGWSIEDQRFCVQTSRYTWESIPDQLSVRQWSPDSRGVALIRATPAPRA
jgi:hypothetical protein